MSGERVLVAHKIKFLADEPLVGPLETDVVLSAPSVSGLGNKPSLSTAVVDNGIAAPTSVLTLNISSVTTSSYFSSTAPYSATPVISVGGSQLNISAKQLKGRFRFFGQVTTTAIVPSPTEPNALLINVTDNLGASLNQSLRIPILAPDPYSHGFEVCLPVCFPYNAARSGIQATVRLVNDSTITTQCVNGRLMLEIDQ